MTYTYYEGNYNVTNFCIHLYMIGHLWWCVCCLDAMEVVLWKEPLPVINTGWDSVVAIATRYRLDGLGIESQRGQILRTHPDRPWDLPSLLYNGYRVPSPGVKWLGCGIRPPPPSAEVKERIELYLYSPPGPLWRVIGWTLAFTFYLYQWLVVVSLCACTFWAQLYNVTNIIITSVCWKHVPEK